MTKKYLDATGVRVLWQKIRQGFVAKDGNKVLSTNDFTTAYKNKVDAAYSAVTTPVSITINRDSLDETGKSVTITKAQAAAAGSYPRLLLLDPDGMELTPESVIRYGATEAIKITFTAEQVDILESDKEITAVLIH